MCVWICILDFELFIYEKFDVGACGVKVGGVKYRKKVMLAVCTVKRVIIYGSD